MDHEFNSLDIYGQGFKVQTAEGEKGTWSQNVPLPLLICFASCTVALIFVADI